MPTWENQVTTDKKAIGNVVILLDGLYYAMREPDSGLAIDSSRRGLIMTLTVNPTKVDLKRVNTTIASTSFRMLDKFRGGEHKISKLFADREDLLIGLPVRIFLGRSNVDMDFADYFELPTINIQDVDHADSTYNFKCTDTTERMDKPAFDQESILTGELLNVSTELGIQSTEEFPVLGLIKINKELMSYTGKTGATLENLVRGEDGTPIPASHEIGSDIFLVEKVIGNPLDIFLQILTSTGTGLNGDYDLLNDGLGIDESLIDITEIEAIRDEFFNTEVFTIYLYGIESVLKVMEPEILAACNLRMVTNESSKISLTLLDQSSFDESSGNPIGETSISKDPQWKARKNLIVNNIEIQYDYNEGSGIYEQKLNFKDDDSIAIYGKQRTLKLKWKAVREADDGSIIVNQRGQRLLQRFKTPNPEITVVTHLDKSLYNVGDKVLLTSRNIPSGSGGLTFADSLEVISRAINWLTGDVTFKLQYTSYAGIRGSFIAPCVSISAVTNQKTVTFPVGRGDGYETGWVIRLFNKETMAYEPDPINIIQSVSGDVVTFQNDFITLLDETKHLIRFADYDQVNDSQKKFAFVGIAGGGNFDDGSSPYKIGI